MSYCPICGGVAPEHIRVKMTQPEWLAAGGDPIRIWSRCSVCGHLFVDPMPEQALLYRVTDEWEKTQKPPLDEFLESTGNPFDAMIAGHSLERCCSLFGLCEPITMIDVGAGIGKGAIQAAMLGWQVIAIERRPEVGPVYEGIGVSLIVDDAINCSTLHVADLVWCEEVIEHISDPVAFFKHIADWVVPGGGLYLTTPNAAWYRTWPPEMFACMVHVHGFTPWSIRSLAKQAGLHVTGIEPAWSIDRTMAVYCRKGH